MARDESYLLFGKPHNATKSDVPWPSPPNLLHLLQAFTLGSYSSKTQLSLLDLSGGFLPNGLFTRLIGQAVLLAQRTSSIDNLDGLFSDVAVLRFGSQEFRIKAAAHMHAVRVDVGGASPLAVLRRIEQIVSQLCAGFMGALECTVALPQDAHRDSTVLIPLRTVQNSVSNGVPICGRFGKILVSAEDAKSRFLAFVPNRDILDSYDLFISYRQGAARQGDNGIADRLFDLAATFTVGSEHREMRVFVDTERMQGGLNLATQASQAISASLIFVPLISNSTLERMLHHDPSKVDWVLFEAIVAFECLDSPISRLERIFSLWEASQELLAQLPELVPAKTLRQAQVELRALGVADSESSKLSTYTVKSIVEKIQGFVGHVETCSLSDDDVAAEGIERIVEILHTCKVDSGVDNTHRLIRNILHHQQVDKGISWEGGLKLRRHMQDLVREFDDYQPEVIITSAIGQRSGVDADGCGLGLLYTRLLVQVGITHYVQIFAPFVCSVTPFMLTRYWRNTTCRRSPWRTCLSARATSC